MKHWTKLIAAVAAVVMAVALCVPALAFAADGDDAEAATGTITVENATYGKAYTAYKVFDATFSGDKISYKTAAGNASKLDATLFGWSTAADADGNISVWALEDADEADIVDWVKANYDKFDATGKEGTFNAKNATVTFEDMPYGYYYITSTLGTAIAIDSSSPDATVKDKNASAPTTPTKTIVSVDGVDASGITADAHVGSVIGYKIEGNATNWTTTVGDEITVTENTAYAFEDTFTNMAINESSIQVKVNGEDPLVAVTATVSNGKISVNIPLVNSDGKHVYEAKNTATDETAGYIPIEITYTATITAAAAGAPATNEVGDTTVKVYTYAFQVAKVDGDNEPLDGAGFELWSKKGGDTDAKLTFIDNGDGTYTYSEEGTVTTLLANTDTNTISILGLDKAWSYTLKETQVPEGYNQAEDKTIAGSSLTQVTENTDTKYTSEALYKETVVNKEGVALPSTGGMGTTILYVVGGIMIVVAAVYLVSRRRASKTDKSDDLM